MITQSAATLDEADFPWIATLPDKQRKAVSQMMPGLVALTRESDELTAGKVFIQMIESQFATRKNNTPQAGLALSLLRGRLAREELKQRNGGSISAAEAAEKIGISKTAVLKRYHEGKMLGWREARQDAVRFPVWQFADDNLLPGIPEVLAILNQAPWMDDWSRILFFLNRHSSLGEKSPLDLLKKGRHERVMWAATAEVA